MFPLHLPFFVLTHIWVVPIYVLYVVATVLVCVGIFVVLLPPILEWSYPLFVFGHTISVWCHNINFRSSPRKLGIIPLWMLLNSRNVLCLHTLHQNFLPTSKRILGIICVYIVLVSVCIGNIIWAPEAQWVNRLIGPPLVSIHTFPCKYTNKWIHFWLAVTGYIDE